VVADPVVDAALQGANRSYAPYTKDFSGVGLECEDGRVYSGGYEENAAYDPGVSPFQAAFAMLLLGVGPLAPGAAVKVSRAVLVELSLEPSKGADLVLIFALSSIAPDVKLELRNASCRAPSLAEIDT